MNQKIHHQWLVLLLIGVNFNDFGTCLPSATCDCTQNWLLCSNVSNSDLQNLSQFVKNHFYYCNITRMTISALSGDNFTLTNDTFNFSSHLYIKGLDLLFDTRNILSLEAPSHLPFLQLPRLFFINITGPTLNFSITQSTFNRRLKNLRLSNISFINPWNEFQSSALELMNNLKIIDLINITLPNPFSITLHVTSQIRRVLLQNNRIHNVSKIRCKTECYIYSLQIKDNEIKFWDNTTFENVQGIMNLNFQEAFAKNIENQCLANITQSLSVLRSNTNLSLQFIQQKVVNLHQFPNDVIKSLCDTLSNQLFRLAIDFGIFRRLDEGNFRNCQQIRNLEIKNWISYVQTISSNVFDGLDRLKSLSIENCNIETFPKSALSMLTSLTNLSLSWCNMRVEPDSFHNILPQLTHVNMNNCYRKGTTKSNTVQILRNIFRDQPHLRTLEAVDFLHFHYENEKPGAEAWFGNNTNLEYINLKDNNFLYSSNREWIDNQFYSKMFHGLKKLKVLDLSTTSFGQVIDFDVLLPIADSLETLTIRNCKLSLLRSNYARRFLKLQNLMAKQNLISTFKFYMQNNSFPNLKTIDVSFNSLETVNSESVDALKTMKNLTQFEIFGNRWRCDCNLQEFRDWLIAFTYNDGKCSNLIEHVEITKFSIPWISCYNNKLKLLFASILLFIIFMISVGLLCYRYIWRIQLYCIFLSLCWRRKRSCNQLDQHKNKASTVFVVYVASDLPFILQNIVPKLDMDDVSRILLNEEYKHHKHSEFDQRLLEVARSHNIRLLLPDRDFRFGGVHLNSINQAICESDFVLMICSRAAFSSNEFLFSTNMTFYNILEKRKSNKLLLFFFEPPDDISINIRPPLLQYSHKFLRQIYKCMVYPQQKKVDKNDHYESIDSSMLNHQQQEFWIKLVLTLCGR